MQNEVQDFSMPSKKQAALSGSKSGNKLDDTLSKLMKRKNCVSTFYKRQECRFSYSGKYSYAAVQFFFETRTLVMFKILFMTIMIVYRVF
jgi:hypothetical protein